MGTKTFIPLYNTPSSTVCQLEHLLLRLAILSLKCSLESAEWGPQEFIV